MGRVDAAKGLTLTYRSRHMVAWTSILALIACSGTSTHSESKRRLVTKPAMLTLSGSVQPEPSSPSAIKSSRPNDFAAASEKQSIAALFAGGPVYKMRETSISEIKNSGFTHLIVWTIHVEENGNLGFNGEFPLVKDGQYIGDRIYPEFRADMAALKQAPSSIQRLEFALSAAGSGTYENIKRLATCDESQCSLGTDSVLYKNFNALHAAFPDVDAINNDDESVYDLTTAVPFHAMLAALGFKTSVAPYNNQSFWAGFVTALNRATSGSADIAYLQVYDGGAGNDPCSWQLGIPVVAGMWSKYTTPTSAKGRLREWTARCQLRGGFLWLYDEVVGTPVFKEYADAIGRVWSF